jgi:ABC-type dipeptide/oligopeptide/nickel transport system ATPase component
MGAGTKHALLIGINDYKHGEKKDKWDDLDNPVTDVENMRKSLVRYGFDNPVILTDKRATAENIRKELNELRRKTELEDDVVIFFAGHGERNPQTDKLELVPSDYYKGNEYVITGDQIAEYIDSMSANNVLLTLDCCFSGSIHSRLNAVTQDEEYYPHAGATSRYALTSGGEELVKDGYSGSPFTNAFADCLNFNEEPVIEITEVFAYIQDELKQKKYKQKPDLRHLSVKSHRSGMFGFFLDDTKRSSVVGEAERLMPPNSVEAEYLPRTVSQFEKGDDFNVLLRKQRVRTLETVVKENSFVALIGIAGAGKTYELLHVQHCLWRERRLISIDISLDNYTGQPISSYLPSFWRFLRHDRVVLYFDGLDELPAQVFPLAIRELNDFVSKNPTVKVVVSCRTNFYSLPYDQFEGTFSGITLVSLDDISTYVMTEYVNNQIPGDDGNFIRELIINSYDDIAGKAYYFAALFKYYKKHGNLAISRSDLFDRIIQDGIDENVNKYRNTTLLKAGQLLFILKRLAHLMARLGKRVLTDEEVYEVISDPTEQELLRYLPFIESGTAEKLWRFEHNNIQELLSAKVLANLPAAEILSRIVVKDVGMVAQYWMNTLSFVITLAKESTRNQLLDWLLKNDPDIMIRFERERIDDTLRAKIACTVFDNYTKQNIWLSSNRFNDRDLARFGNTPEFTEHLLVTLENPNYSANIYGNVFRILKYYPTSAIEQQKERWKAALYAFLKLHVTEDYLMYDALFRISDFFGKDDPALIDQCILLLGRRKNAYIRAGLYRLIVSGDSVDRHLSLICDGLSLDEIEGIEDRTTVNLDSESRNLIRAIQAIRKPATIKSLLSFITHKHQGGFVSGTDIVSVTSAITEVAERLFQEDNSLAQALTDFIYGSYAHLQIEKYRHFSVFYQNTGTAITTIKYILLHAKPEKKLLESDFIKLLLENRETLDTLKLAYTNADIDSESIRVIHEMLKHGLWWYEKSQVLLQFEEVFGGFPEIGLSIKEVSLPAVTLEQQLNKKIGYVFDTEGLKDCFAGIYNTLGEGEKTIEEIMEQSARVQEFSNITNEVFRHYYQSGEAPTKTELSEWIDKSADFAIIRLIELYTILMQDKNKVIDLTDEQVRQVEEWINIISETDDLQNLLLQGRFTDQVLWFFIQTLPITVPEKLLLAFSVYGQYSYTDVSPEVLIALEGRLPEETLKQRVIQNIEDDLPYSRWLPNVIFGLKNKISSTYPVIQRRLLEAEDYLNHVRELLEIWVKQTDDLSFIDNLMHNGKNAEIRLSAATIKLNSEKDNSSTIQYLETRLSDSLVSDHEKKRIAVELIAWNSVTGLSHLTEKIITGEVDSLGQTGNFKKITNPDCIPMLLKLMAYAREGNSRNHRREHMVGDIGTALFTIGIQSHESYLMLKDQIEAFLQVYESSIPDLSILRVTLMNVKEAKTMDYEEFTIAEFEQDFKSYTFRDRSNDK